MQMVKRKIFGAKSSSFKLKLSSLVHSNWSSPSARWLCELKLELKLGRKRTEFAKLVIEWLWVLPAGRSRTEKQPAQLTGRGREWFWGAFSAAELCLQKLSLPTKFSVISRPSCAALALAVVVVVVVVAAVARAIAVKLRAF